MKSCRLFADCALVSISFCLMLVYAQAQVIPHLSDGIAARPFATDVVSDLIFDGGFEGQNGGTSCASAPELTGGLTYTSDTTFAPNWMDPFGPLPSPSNDVVYMFVAGPDVQGSIIPTASDYAFTMFLIPSCNDSGNEPVAIGATATIGAGIDLSASGVISGNTYYLAVTGDPNVGEPGSNGILTFTTPASIELSSDF